MPRPVCNNHPESPDPCIQPATHRIITADGTVRAHACRVAERYLLEGERSEPIVQGTAQIRLSKQQKAPPTDGAIDVSPIIADLKRLRSLIAADNTEAHALLAQVVGKIALLG